MVEDGTFGGPTCAPVARQIYEAILKREKSGSPEADDPLHETEMCDPSLNEKKSDFDWPLHAATLGLMLIGTAFIFSATARHMNHAVAWYPGGLCAAE